jgi:hypothetical protein
VYGLVAWVDMCCFINVCVFIVCVLCVAMCYLADMDVYGLLLMDCALFTVCVDVYLCMCCVCVV